MTQFPGALLVSLVAASILSAQGVSGVVIRVHNYARLDDRIVQGAQHRTTSILNEAGTAVKWIHCRTSPQRSGGMPGCADPLAELDILLNLLPQAMARNTGQTSETFGFAVPTKPAGLGIAYVFTDRTDQLAFGGPFSVSVDIARPLVLGHVIAHEIGHLLLGPKSHSLHGIMSAQWSAAEVRRLSTANLFFTAHEGAVIRRRFAASAGTPRSVDGRSAAICGEQ